MVTGYHVREPAGPPCVSHHIRHANVAGVTPLSRTDYLHRVSGLGGGLVGLPAEVGRRFVPDLPNRRVVTAGPVAAVTASVGYKAAMSGRMLLALVTPVKQKWPPALMDVWKDRAEAQPSGFTLTVRAPNARRRAHQPCASGEAALVIRWKEWPRLAER